jgi:hypothetical protein
MRYVKSKGTHFFLYSILVLFLCSSFLAYFLYFEKQREAYEITLLSVYPLLLTFEWLNLSL